MLSLLLRYIELYQIFLPIYHAKINSFVNIYVGPKKGLFRNPSNLGPSLTGYSSQIVPELT